MVVDESIALVMVKPDGVHQDLSREVVGWLREHGYKLLDMRRLRLSAEARALLYVTTRTAGVIDWELNAMLYRLGPVDALLFSAESWPLNRESAAEYLSQDLKGHFIPTRAKADTLRGDLNAINPIFNLVHASDSRDECRREIPVLFGTDFSRPETHPTEPAGKDSLLALPPRAIDPWPLIGTVLAALISPDSPAAGHEALHAYGWPGLRSSDRRMAYAQAHEAVQGIGEGIRQGTLRDVHPMLPRLAGGECQTAASFLDFQAILRSISPELSDWDTYLTFTTLRYLSLCLEEET